MSSSSDSAAGSTATLQMTPLGFKFLFLLRPGIFAVDKEYKLLFLSSSFSSTLSSTLSGSEDEELNDY